MSDRLNPDVAHCPYCGADLKYGDEMQYSRIIGIYDMDLDITIAWRCPDCGREDERK